MRTEQKWGNVYDHFAVCYEWANGVKTFAYTRQMADCMMDTEDYVAGTKGSAQVLANTVTTHGESPWKYTGDKPSMYDLEHVALFKAIREGNAINNGQYMSQSTLMAIMGREACYTGQLIKWDDAMQSQTSLSPKEYVWGDVPVPQVATPGVTKFA